MNLLTWRITLSLPHGTDISMKMLHKEPDTTEKA